MAVTDNFDSYNNGDLNGQGDWSGDVEFDVQTTIKQAGTKAVKIANLGANYKEIYKTFTGEGDGNQVFYIRFASGSDRYAMFHVGEVATGNKARIQIHDYNSGEFRLYASTNEQILSGLTTDQWYKCEIEWRTSDDSVRARVNDGTWTNWLACSSSFTVIDRIGMQAGKNSDQYFDTFLDPNVSATDNSILFGINF